MFKHATSSCRLHVNISTYGSAGQLCAVNSPTPGQVSLPAARWPGCSVTNRRLLPRFAARNWLLLTEVERAQCSCCTTDVLTAASSFSDHTVCIISVINVFSLFVFIIRASLFQFQWGGYRRCYYFHTPPIDFAAGVYVSGRTTELLGNDSTELVTISVPKCRERFYAGKNTYVHICILRLLRRKKPNTLTHSHTRNAGVHVVGPSAVHVL